MKRFATMAAVLALLLGCLAGCGQAPQSDSFRFGGIGPLTGKNAIYGESVRHGMEIAVAEINEAGGINGTPVTLSFADDAGDAESSVNAYNKLMDDGMQLLLGTVTTDPALSVGALAYKDRTFMLTPSASSPDVTAGATMCSRSAFPTSIRAPARPITSAPICPTAASPLSTATTTAIRRACATISWRPAGRSG